MVVVDTNLRWAGTALDLEVELLGIETSAAGPDTLGGGAGVVGEVRTHPHSPDSDA